MTTDALMTLRCVVQAPVDVVAELLLDIRPKGQSPIMPSGRITRMDNTDEGIRIMTFEQDGSQVAVEVDAAARTLSLQGQWWYRAEFRLTAHHDGCLVTQQISNVAARLRWAVRYVARKPLAAAPDAFDELVRALGQRLSCPTYLVS